MEVYELLVLSRLLKYVRTLQCGIYYLFKEERDLIARFNEEADRGEANRLYLLQMAQSLELEPHELLLLRQLEGKEIGRID
jgi:hypothetical protein